MNTERPYQSDARGCITQEWASGVVATAAVMPTGTGKTVVFANVIKSRLPKRALVVAHREELIWQARQKIEKFAGAECGIEMGDLFVNNSLFGDQQVIVSTIQTLNSKLGDRFRMGRFKPDDFDTLICDECHHATAQTYRRVFDYFKQNPNLRILGVTATPDRADEEALGQVFETVAFDYEILDAINDGWLVPIEQQFVSIGGLDFSDIRTTAGDLNGADLANVMESERNMQGVCGASIDIIGKKRTILFTCSVRQAEQACEIFNRHRPGMAAWVCGTTNKDDRRAMLERYKGGDIQVICNCGVLTEGFDDPGVEVILQGRPTKSRSLYAQMCGRGTRPLDGLVDQFEEADARKEAIRTSAKPSCLVVDFVGNSGKHKLMSAADILGGKQSAEVVERAIVEAKKKGTAVRIDTALTEEEEKLKAEIEARKQREAARKAKLVAKVTFSKKIIDPFDLFDINPVRERGWDSGKVLSEKQSQLLMRQGINPDTLTYTQSRQLIGEICRRFQNKLCTVKQANRLSKYGYSTKNMTMEQAKILLTQLSGKGWRQPLPDYVSRVNARIEHLSTERDAATKEKA